MMDTYFWCQDTDQWTQRWIKWWKEWKKDKASIKGTPYYPTE